MSQRHSSSFDLNLPPVQGRGFTQGTPIQHTRGGRGGSTPRGGTHQSDLDLHAQNRDDRGGYLPSHDESTDPRRGTHQRDLDLHDLIAQEEELERLKEKLKKREAELAQFKGDRDMYKNKYEELLLNAMGKERKAVEQPTEVPQEKPEDLAKAWERFKNETYGNAVIELRKKASKPADDRKIRTFLLDCCKAFYSHCFNEEAEFQASILALFRRGKENEEKLEKDLKKAMMSGKRDLLTLTDREVQKTIDSVMEIFRRSTTFLGDLEAHVLEEIQQRRRQAATPEKRDAALRAIQGPQHKDLRSYFNICKPYASECYNLCRRMQLHIPAMALDFEVKEGSRVNEHDVLNDNPGRGMVDQLLVPALYRSREGGLLVKGLVSTV